MAERRLQREWLVPAVIDTDVVSFLFKRDSRAKVYEPHLNDPPFLISFMSLAELRRWSLERNWGESKRLDLESYLERYAVLHSNAAICEWWAKVMRNARLNGLPIGSADSWIAATALYLNVPLVTHNSAHYAGVDGLRVISSAR